MSVSFTLKKQTANKDNVHDALNSLQTDLVGIMTQITNSVFSQMQLLTNVTISTTATPVAHNLGYVCRGFVVVNKSATFDVYRDALASNPDPLRYVMLVTSAGTQTVNILVF